MKNIFIMFIAFLIIGFAIVPQVHAQTQQQMEELARLGNDFSAGKITYAEYLQRVTEVMEPPTTAVNSQLASPAGKAWVIQDNQTQGSGKAIVLKADGSYEHYNRILGIWRPSRITVYAENSYTATGNRISFNTSNSYYNNYTGEYNYSISNNGSTLTITADRSRDEEVSGTYTLRDLPRVAEPGGNIVNRPGTAWNFQNRSISNEIFHSDGIQYGLGGSGARDQWDFYGHESWYTYTANSGRLTRISKGRDTERPEVLNYSITDFGGGNITLRLWKVDRNFPYDEVFKLVQTPSGFQLPNVR